MSYSAVFRLMEAASPKFAKEREQIEALLAESDRLLQPLGEPLRCDFGLHRWLSNAREEAYSDWLAWALEQTKCLSSIYEILGIPTPLSTPDSQPAVTREAWVPEGNEGRTGRLDIVVCAAEKRMVVIETKINKGEPTNLEKQKGYIQSLYEPRPACFLITCEAQQPDYYGFRVLLWREVCIGLRRAVVSGRFANNLISAMVLCFVGSVEQNLLGIQEGRARLTQEKLEYVQRINQIGKYNARPR